MYIFQHINNYRKNLEICRRAGIGRQAGLRDQ
jgi:hypothetical protein